MKHIFFLDSKHPWLQYSYPSYTPILLHAVDLWCHDPQVTTPVLKLFAELVQNRSQRLQFDVSSPNGILLFREASKVICSYGEYFSTVLFITEKNRSNCNCYLCYFTMRLTENICGLEYYTFLSFFYLTCLIQCTAEVVCTGTWCCCVDCVQNI
jgi:hypothetical protein